MILEDFLDKLERVKNGVPGQYSALCPAHEDKERSLSISLGDKKIICHCHAGCDFDAICHAMNLKPEDLFFEDKTVEKEVRRTLIATYNYYDEDAVLVYKVLRFEPKDFRMQDAEGHWFLPKKRVLYNFPAVLHADSETIIWITEGEKDADRLIALGLCATTNVGGADSWREEYTDYFANQTVYLCQDKDNAGLERTKKLLPKLKRVGCDVVVKEAKVGKDISDHLDAGLTIEELETFDPSVLTVPPTSLPEGFWRSRPELEHIRKAAHSRQRSAEAVLHAVLSRVAASCPHQIKIPPIIAAQAALSYFTICLDDSGVGKSSIGRIARELIPPVKWLRDDITIGSGQGIAKVLMGQIPDPNDPTKTIYGQEHHNANLILDEGLVLKGLVEQTGTLLVPTLCTIWTGGPFGQQNATDMNSRLIEDGSYNFGLFIAIQTKNCGFIMEEESTGLPQRFSWAMATDSLVPDIADQPDWPGELTFRLPVQTPQTRFVTIDPKIIQEVKEADLAKVRGEEKESIKSHYYLYRLKTAAVLAILNGRLDVTLDDWKLSEVISKVSDACRLAAKVVADEEKARLIQLDRYMAGQKKLAEYKVIEDARDSKLYRDVARLAYWAALKVREKSDAAGGHWTEGGLRRKAPGRDRELVEMALDAACEKKWVQQRDVDSLHIFEAGPVPPVDPSGGL